MKYTKEMLNTMGAKELLEVASELQVAVPEGMHHRKMPNFIIAEYKRQHFEEKVLVTEPIVKEEVKVPSKNWFSDIVEAYAKAHPQTLKQDNVKDGIPVYSVKDNRLFQFIRQYGISSEYKGKVSEAVLSDYWRVIYACVDQDIYIRNLAGGSGQILLLKKLV